MKHIVLFSFLCCLVACIASPHLLADEPEMLTVHVTLIDHTGQSAPGIEIIAGHTEGEVAGIGKTDASGHVTIALARPAEATRLGILISEGIEDGIDPGDRAQRFHAFWQLARNNAWDSYIWSPLEANATEKTVTIVLRPAIAIRGRLPDPIVPAFGEGHVQRRNSERISHPKDLTREFVLVSVPRGEPTDIFVFGECITWIALTAEQTQADLDVGDLAATCGDSDAFAVLTLDAANWPPPLSNALVRGVTLIRSDGVKLTCFFVDQNGQAYLDTPDGRITTIPIPSGTWYLVPGGFDPDEDLPLRAFDLVRSGQTALVPNWPTITVAPGETATATVHAAELDAAIRATMPPE